MQAAFVIVDEYRRGDVHRIGEQNSAHAGFSHRRPALVGDVDERDGVGVSKVTDSVWDFMGAFIYSKAHGWLSALGYYRVRFSISRFQPRNGRVVEENFHCFGFAVAAR